MKFPKKISPSPIAEAVTEIRFENELPSAVIFGRLYAGLSKDFSQTEQLPILEMPAQFREMQPELKYAPHYRLKNEKFIVNIGQRIISVNRVCTKHEYSNWDEYFKVIKQVFKEVEKIGVVTETKSVSVRYINFIEQDVPTVLNLEIDLFQTKVTDYKELVLSFMQEIKADSKLRVNIASNAKIEAENGTREGLVVNLEAYKDSPTSMKELAVVIDSLHTVAEEGFFTALNPKFLESLNPVYAK